MISDAELLEALAQRLAPLVARYLGESASSHLVDVAASVPASKRALYRACRRGEIEGATRVARRWLAPRAAIEAWLRARGPRLVPAPTAEADDLEPLRRRLLAGGRR